MIAIKTTRYLRHFYLCLCLWSGNYNRCSPLGHTSGYGTNVRVGGLLMADDHYLEEHLDCGLLLYKPSLTSRHQQPTSCLSRFTLHLLTHDMMWHIHPWCYSTSTHREEGFLVDSKARGSSWSSLAVETACGYDSCFTIPANVKQPRKHEPLSKNRNIFVAYLDSVLHCPPLSWNTIV